MLVYAPSTIQEACDLMVTAFEKAAQYQAPMMLCVDGCIGSMMQPLVLPEMKKVKPLELSFAASESINPRRRIVTSLISGEERQEAFNRRLAEMYARWEAEETRVECWGTEDAEVVLAAYGVSARVARTAAGQLRGEGLRVGLIRPITLSPFPYAAFDRLDYSRVRHVVSVELAIPPQMVEDIELGVARRAPVSAVTHAGGVLMTADEVAAAVRDLR